MYRVGGLGPRLVGHLAAQPPAGCPGPAPVPGGLQLGEAAVHVIALLPHLALGYGEQGAGTLASTSLWPLAKLAKRSHLSWSIVRIPAEVSNLGEGRRLTLHKLLVRVRTFKSGGSAITPGQPIGLLLIILESTVSSFVSFGSKISVNASSFSDKIILFKAIFIQHISVPVKLITKWTLASSRHVILHALIASKLSRIVVKTIIGAKPVQVSG